MASTVACSNLQKSSILDIVALNLFLSMYFVSQYRLLLFLSLLFLSPVASSKGNWKERSTPVRIGTVEQILLAPTDWVVGEVLAKKNSQIAAQIAGKITWLPEAGMHVKKGERLIKQDSADIELKIRQSRTRIAASKSRLAFLEKELKRFQKLEQSGHVSETRVDTARKERDIAEAEWHGAQAELAILEKQLRDSEVHAPFTGIVMTRLKEPYEWAKKGDPLLRLVTSQQVEVRVFVPVRMLSNLRLNQEIRLKSEDHVFSGYIRQLIGAASSATHQAEIRIQPDNKQENLRLIPGEFILAAIPVQKAKRALTVPRDALVLRSDSTRVFKISPDLVATPVTVTTGYGNPERIEIHGNLKAGDRVVVRGGERLRPGQKVRIISDQQVDSRHADSSREKTQKKAWTP
ncbi:MAG: efflux RND transporter periplasmic adaptor subunit [Gammaproteobacteria bacterium]|nr:MAG: efflux RND transporter periplasmic adaptor subunit [Gammaproteobacteria bacterium]